MIRKFFYAILPMGLGLLAVPAFSQWIKVPPVTARRTKSGEIVLMALEMTPGAAHNCYERHGSEGIAACSPGSRPS
jgi:hypothetical protein